MTDGKSSDSVSQTTRHSEAWRQGYDAGRYGGIKLHLTSGDWRIAEYMMGYAIGERDAWNDQMTSAWSNDDA